ncbi:MAG: SPOR domain-containing protein [Prolixibacteraceae bacterium]|jgi:hypothetical protein|nr:SPOR domain-containing protein [Prolixibacteraceae bacterium]
MKNNVLKASLFAVIFLAIISFVRGQNYSFEVAPFSESDSVITKSVDNLYLATDSDNGESSHLTINSDERLNELLEISKEENKRNNGITGYRVQIFQGEKDKAYGLKARFLQSYPDYEAHILFKTPDFRVRVGDCRSRSEAIKIKYLIEKNFPNAFVVEDVINYPKLKTD